MADNNGLLPPRMMRNIRNNGSEAADGEVPTVQADGSVDFQAPSGGSFSPQAAQYNWTGVSLVSGVFIPWTTEAVNSTGFVRSVADSRIGFPEVGIYEFSVRLKSTSTMNALLTVENLGDIARSSDPDGGILIAIAEITNISTQKLRCEILAGTLDSSQVLYNTLSIRKVG
jgi:hypothetical protein